jgi:hypothetical protein
MQEPYFAGDPENYAYAHEKSNLDFDEAADRN